MGNILKSKRGSLKRKPRQRGAHHHKVKTSLRMRQKAGLTKKQSRNQKRKVKYAELSTAKKWDGTA